MLRPALASAAFVLLARPALADLQVRMPEVDYREFEFEHNGLVTFDTKGSPLNHAQSYTNSIGYGVLPWWEIELEGELASGGGQHLTWDAVTLENTFQLTEPGEYFFNLGFFFEYSQSTQRGEPSGVTFSSRPASSSTATFQTSRMLARPRSSSTGSARCWPVQRTSRPTAS
jgi:hypothetical protein